MDEVLNAILGFLTGVFGIMLGMAYFLPLLVLVLAVAIAFYVYRRRGRAEVFTAEEPGAETERRDL